MEDQVISNIIAGVSAILFLLNIILTTKITLETFDKSNKDKQKSFLDQQLFELQRLSFYDSFVEDLNFINNWNILKEQYLSNNISEEEKQKFLKYDVYTEMLFNYLRMSLDFYKNEDALLKYVDFKNWIRDHKLCWENPIHEHSNREVYGKDMYDMVEDWLR